MELKENEIYQMEIGDSKAVVKFKRTMGYPATGMPADYIFEGIAGKFPRHEMMFPEFPMPEFIISQAVFTPYSESNVQSQDDKCKALLKEYRNTPLFDPRATELEQEFWALKSENTKELIREVLTDRLAKTAAEPFMDILTIFLGLSIGAIMTAEMFLVPQTLVIFALGLVAFATATAAGVLVAKLMNLISKDQINPMIGAAGVSAVPMSSRVVQRMGQQANPRNFLLMHAMGPNIAGVIGTATVAGVFLGMLG